MAIRKTKQDVEREFPARVLYRCDVESLIQVFAELGTDLKIEIDNYSLDSIADLDQLNLKRAKNLSIDLRRINRLDESSNSDSNNVQIVRVHLTTGFGQVSIRGTDKTETRGLIDRVGEILGARRPRARLLSKHGLASLVILSLMIWTLVWYFGDHFGVSKANAPAVSTTLSAVLTGVLFLLRESSDHPVIRLDKHQPESWALKFWSAKKHELLMGLILLIVGYALGKL